jgi:hypothetical protein
MPERYRKKPIEVEAMLVHAETSFEDFLDPNTRAQAEIAGWMMGNGFRNFKVHGERAPFGIAIKTLEGVMVAEPGDWIIRGVQGEFYPCKPDIFAATYERVPTMPEPTPAPTSEEEAAS